MNVLSSVIRQKGESQNGSNKKTSQVFRKTMISYPLVRTRTLCVSGVRILTIRSIGLMETMISSKTFQENITRK